MAQSKRQLLPTERRAVAGLAGILSLRMLGFYAVLPILSVYAATLPGAKAVWIGLTVGAYGLTQAIFQIPMGYLSDRYGRRRAIVVGLLIFALGSIVAGLARDVPLLIVGRTLQGAGAGASVIIALTADLTRPKARTRAMAILGMAIGLSFGVGFVIGPPVAARFGVPMLFYLTGALSLLAALYVSVFLPRTETEAGSDRMSMQDVLQVLARRELVLLNLGVLSVHLSLTCLFVVLPIEIEHYIERSALWTIYLPVIAAGLVLMYFAARRADHPGWARPILWTGASLLAVSCLYLAFAPTGLRSIIIGLFGFTCGVALAEPILPALLTRFSPPEIRGTAAGVFNVHQFGGGFLGGLLGGASLAVSLKWLFVLLAAELLLWTILARRLPNPFRVEIARRRQERRVRSLVNGIDAKRPGA